jgi:hypothetical protein
MIMDRAAALDGSVRHPRFLRGLAVKRLSDRNRGATKLMSRRPPPDVG